MVSVTAGARRSLLGDLLRSKAVARFAATVGNNLLALAGLGAIDAAGWTASRVAGLLVTGASLLIVDFKLRG